MAKEKHKRLTYTRLESPFVGKTREEIANLLKSFGQQFVDEFPTMLADLQARLKEVYPLQFLSILSFYHLTSPVGTNRELKDHELILQHQVETVQALILQNTIDCYSQLPIQPQKIDEIEKVIREVTQSFHMRRFAAIDPSMSDAERERLAMLAHISGHTQAVRNWGYPQQIRQIVKELFEPLDDEIEKTIGVRVAHLVEMLFSVTELIETRINAHYQKLRPMVRAHDARSAVYAYYESFPDLAPEQEQFLLQMKGKKVTLQQIKSMLLSHADLRLEDTYTLTITDFVSSYPQSVDLDVLKRVLDVWVFALGDLANVPTERLFLANPIWEHPLIHTADNSYFLPIPGLFLSFCLELMEAVVKPHADLDRKYEKRRGQFLEQILYDLCVRAFRHASIFRGSIWRDPTTQQDYENDLLILNDSFLFIVEAKSGRVNQSARRGGELRLERALAELVAAPALQSKRFADFLRQNSGKHRFGSRRGVFNEIDTSNVRHIVRLNVTLELIGDLIVRQPALQRAGLLDADHEIVPTICYTDLEIVFEVLEGTCEKIHYLNRRTEFETHANYFGDEMDLLSFYLDTGFNIGENEFSEQQLWLFGLSKTLEPFFMQEWTKTKADKPRLRLTKWWRDLLQKIEERRAPRWTEIGYVLLNTLYQDQLSFEQKYHRRKTKVQSDWRDPDVKNILVLDNGPPQRKDAVAVLMYKRVDREERNRMLQIAADRGLDSSNAGQGVAIGMDIEQKHYPYSVIAFFERNKNNA
ncbi:hypothetical protein FBQ82_00575 [Anaerolineae bacterium CFX7]|nr:hypothetical protein [Anaerolineae bacterium CFX7]